MEPKITQRGQKTKDKILQTATELFAEKGFHGTRVDELAERAKINKQRIYAYFGNKEGLFTEVMAQTLKSVAEAEEEFVKGLDKKGDEFWIALLRYYLDFHEDNQHFWRLLVWENLESGNHAPMMRSLRATSLESLREKYSLDQQSGNRSPEVMFESFWFALTSLAFFFQTNRKTMCHTLKKDLFDPQVREELFQDWLRILGFDNNNTTNDNGASK